jgi:hypothetical protein
MKLRLLTLALLAFGIVARAENEIGFIERFALAADREKVLSELVPGTEELLLLLRASVSEHQAGAETGRDARSMAEALSRLGPPQDH